MSSMTFLEMNLSQTQSQKKMRNMKLASIMGRRAERMTISLECAFPFSTSLLFRCMAYLSSGNLVPSVYRIQKTYSPERYTVVYSCIHQWHPVYAVNSVCMFTYRFHCQFCCVHTVCSFSCVMANLFCKSDCLQKAFCFTRFWVHCIQWNIQNLDRYTTVYTGSGRLLWVSTRPGEVHTLCMHSVYRIQKNVVYTCLMFCSLYESFSTYSNIH